MYYFGEVFIYCFIKLHPRDDYKIGLSGLEIILNADHHTQAKCWLSHRGGYNISLGQLLRRQGGSHWQPMGNKGPIQTQEMYAFPTHFPVVGIQT